MEMFQNVGTTLLHLRELRGLSQAELARKAGIGKSQLSKYERGKELPKLDSLERILSALRVSALGFFYALHLTDMQATALEGGVDIPPDLAFPQMGLLSDQTTQAFGKMTADLLDIYRRIHQDFLFRGRND